MKVLGASPNNQNHRRYNKPNWQEGDCNITLTNTNLSYKDYASILHKLFRRSKNQQVQANAVRLDSLNEIDVELDWIQGVKDQVEFLNANMRYHSISFKIQRHELVGVVTK